jgi:hypothetical protein
VPPSSPALNQVKQSATKCLRNISPLLTNMMTGKKKEVGEGEEEEEEDRRE